jgi:thiol-disulfide isomerase/thioredoxin
MQWVYRRSGSAAAARRPPTLALSHWPSAAGLRALLAWLLLLLCGLTPLGEARCAPGSRLYLPDDLAWLNVSRPLAAADLRGKVVILDFWTYGCVNCIDVAEELKRLEARFGDRLAVIGVHSPKFDHERNLEALRAMVVRLDRREPIVNDPNWRLMELYGARAWPTLAVFAPDGTWVGQLSGEGNEERLARAIDRLLLDFEGAVDERPLPIALERERFAAALLAAPGKVAVSPEGRLVAVADTLHHRVLLAGADGQIQRILGDGESGWRDGPPERARLAAPQGLVFAGRALLVADPGNQTIRSVDLDTGEVRTVAGTGRTGLKTPQREQAALKLDLRSPWDLAERAGQVYVAMAGSHQIWRLSLADGRIAPFAGSGREGIATGGPLEASFSQPSGLARAGDSLFVADPEASAIRRIRLDPARVENLVGTGLFDFGDRDGPLAAAQLQHCAGIAALDPERLVIADSYNHRVKLLDLRAGTLTSVLGNGKAGSRLASPADTELNEPGGLAVLDGRILVADTNNHRILSLDLKAERVEEWPLRRR